MRLYGSTQEIERIRGAQNLRIFLDYDGTLADFAPTPDEIYPDPALIDLLERLRDHPRLKLAIISGRRLSHIRELVPLPGILLMGTYGIEQLNPSGKQFNLLDFQTVRPALDRLKPEWQALIHPHPDFYLEDKGWSLALHAKFVEPGIAEEIIHKARSLVDLAAASLDRFRILGGHKFLEIAPRLASKGLATQNLLTGDPLGGALPIFIGDDDKDEEAFEVILKHGGIAIKVKTQPCETLAQLRLDNPLAVRQFLASLL